MSDVWTWHDAISAGMGALVWAIGSRIDNHRWRVKWHDPNGNSTLPRGSFINIGANDRANAHRAAKSFTVQFGGQATVLHWGRTIVTYHGPKAAHGD